MARKQIAAYVYGAGDVMPDNLKRVAAMLYPDGSVPDGIAQYDAVTLSPGADAPPNLERVAAISYAPGATAPDNLRQVWLGDYASRVRATRPANLIGYWPLWEPSGSTAFDLSGNGRNGAYTGVDLGQPGIGDGRTAPLFDGVSDFVNIYSAGLASAFNGAEGTLLVWAKPQDAAVWSTASWPNILTVRFDVNNSVYLQKNGALPQIAVTYIAGGTTVGGSITTNNDGLWGCYAVTWSKSANRGRVFFNGAQQGADFAGLGVWTGAPPTMLIGANSIVALVWPGTIAHAAIWSVALTPAEIAALSRVN